MRDHELMFHFPRLAVGLFYFWLKKFSHFHTTAFHALDDLFKLLHFGHVLDGLYPHHVFYVTAGVIDEVHAFFGALALLGSLLHVFEFVAKLVDLVVFFTFGIGVFHAQRAFD